MVTVRTDQALFRFERGARAGFPFFLTGRVRQPRARRGGGLQRGADLVVCDARVGVPEPRLEQQRVDELTEKRLLAVPPALSLTAGQA